MTQVGSRIQKVYFMYTADCVDDIAPFNNVRLPTCSYQRNGGSAADLSFYNPHTPLPYKIQL